MLEIPVMLIRAKNKYLCAKRDQRIRNVTSVTRLMGKILLCSK
jgi:hypothetical protein